MPVKATIPPSAVILDYFQNYCVPVPKKGIIKKMPPSLNLDPISILRLATLIMSLSSTAYLFSIRGKTTPTLLLAIALLGATMFNTSLFVLHADTHYWYPFNPKNLLNPFFLAGGASVAAFFFLLFAYHFPRFQDTDTREYKISLMVSALVNACIMGLTVYNCVIQWRLKNDYCLNPLYFSIVSGSVSVHLLLASFLLLRKTCRTSARKKNCWRSIMKPVGEEARAARALALVFLLPMVATLSFLLRFLGIIQPIAMVDIVSYFFLLFYFVVIVAYLNNTEERMTFQVKLVFAVLVVMLGVVSLTVIFVGRIFAQEYENRNLMMEGRTIRFVPNHTNGYHIFDIPFRFEEDIGVDTNIGYGEMKGFDLAFPFSFFGRPYNRIHVLSGPMIFLGEDIQYVGWGGYKPQPAIAPIIMNLDPTSGGGVHLKSEGGKAVITWFEIPEFNCSLRNTVQLLLFRDGSFEFSYRELKPDLSNRYYKLEVMPTANITGKVMGTTVKKGVPFAPRLVGIHPGGKYAPLQAVHFLHDLPYTSTIPGVIFEDYEIDYYRYQHNRMSPLALILIGSSIFILFFFPMLFRSSLIKPLNILYDGMERVDKGDLTVTISPQFNDEIGFLSKSFNRMLRSIKRAESNFKTLAENAEDGILIIAKSGKILYANNRACEITGFNPINIMKIKIDELLGLRKSKTSEKKSERLFPSHFETSIHTGHQKEVHLELTGSRTFWHGQSAEVVVLRDISSRKRSEEQARQQQHHLMKMDKLTSLGILVAGVAHEINNPNQTILSNASFLVHACPEVLTILSEHERDSGDFLIAGLRYEEFRKSFVDLIQGIEGCSGRIDGIVQGLKAFSRDEPAESITSVDVNAVIRSASDLLGSFIQKATDHFTLQLMKDVPRVRGNAQRLEQVLINLILNSCQSLTDRKQKIDVKSSYDEKERKVLIIVRDEGCGIPAEQLRKIKEPFFTTKRALGGTGLGLYVSDSIVKEYRGILKFDSSEVGGTVATVLLTSEEL
jgi:PAS domain S-box-containing protein